MNTNLLHRYISIKRVEYMPLDQVQIEQIQFVLRQNVILFPPHNNVIFRTATKIFEAVMDFWLRLNTN